MVSRWVNRWPGAKRRNTSGAWGRTLRFRWLAWNGFRFLGRHISLKKEAVRQDTTLFKFSNVLPAPKITKSPN